MPRTWWTAASWASSRSQTRNLPAGPPARAGRPSLPGGQSDAPALCAFPFVARILVG